MTLDKEARATGRGRSLCQQGFERKNSPFPEHELCTPTYSLSGRAQSEPRKTNISRRANIRSGQVFSDHILYLFINRVHPHLPPPSPHFRSLPPPSPKPGKRRPTPISADD
ncbi:hypothetical protein CEXT_61 [Caerostris extrusa]|uniref:Uncharacterized protein n=1 Tax=Caerostris extrusa TaxID=172846 RepID=A0AAV4WNY3_CAEEX|nr:hypothetical protein CEXT_61 [Caerostris extrusa]